RGTIAAADADAPDVPEGQSSRLAHPLFSIEFANDEAVGRRRGCGDHHCPEYLDGEWRGAGASVWRAEICHARAARSECSGVAADWDRRSDRRPAIWKHQPSDGHTVRTESNLHDSF